MAFTYTESDLAAGATTAAGRLANVRLLLSDTTNTADVVALFSDAELVAFLAGAGDDMYEAGARAFEVVIRSQTRLYKVIARDGFRDERHALDSLRASAADLRRLSASTGSLQYGTITETYFEHLDAGALLTE